MEIAVRLARRDDADAICDAHVAAWQSGYAHVFPASILHGATFDSERRDRWRAWTHSATSDQRLVVGLVDHQVVGFAHTGHGAGAMATAPDGTSQWSELYGFYVHPDAWGSGVAAAMMAAAVEHLESLAPRRAVLWTLRDADRARAFYEKSGWVTSGQTDTWEQYPERAVAEVEYERTWSTASKDR